MIDRCVGENTGLTKSGQNLPQNAHLTEETILNWLGDPMLGLPTDFKMVSPIVLMKVFVLKGYY